MLRLQAYRFELRTNGEQLRNLRQFAGSCRFVYNKALALNSERYEKKEARLPPSPEGDDSRRENSMFNWLRDQVREVILPASHPVVINRQRVCASCPSKFFVPGLGNFMGPQCTHCKCFVAAKTRVAHEHCPLGKW